MSHFPLSQGGDSRASGGMWSGAGCVGAVFGKVGAMACLHPSTGRPRSGSGCLTLNVPCPVFGAARRGLAS